ncbi:MAG: hypothetical protein KC636_01635 [Myxococcales bacterium]|nr:hypothetical protein [Myxococcales bacterium]
MRLTPAELAVRHLCGRRIPPRSPTSVVECVRDGRARLSRLAGVDYGYDLQAWHDHLKQHPVAGYHYGRNISLPRIMQEALASPAWIEAVRALEAAEG